MLETKIPCKGEGMLELVAREEVGEGDGTLPPPILPPLTPLAAEPPPPAFIAAMPPMIPLVGE